MSKKHCLFLCVFGSFFVLLFNIDSDFNIQEKNHERKDRFLFLLTTRLRFVAKRIIDAND